MRRFRRCLRAFARHRGELLAGAGCLVAASALDVGIPLLVARGLNRLEAAVRAAEPAAVSRDFLLFTVGAIVLGTALKGIFRYGQRYLLIGVSRKVEAELKRDLFAHLTSLSPRFFAASRTGDLLSRATGDLEAVRLFLGPGSMHAASTLLLVPAALIAMVHFHPLLTALVLLPLGALAFSMKAIMPTLNRRSESVQAALAEISERAQENFSGVRVVKGFAREAWEVERFAATSDGYRRHQLGLGRARALNHTLLYASKDLAFLLILLVGGLGLLRGSFPVGGIYLFLDYVNRLFWPLIALGWMAGMYHRAAAGMDRIEEVFRTRPEIVDPPEPLPVGSIRGEIQFRDLTFAYDGEPVLRGIRLRVEPGEAIGIVGRIGSGKTTLVSLLGRLFPVPDATVFLDGVDLNRVPLLRLREAIGFVPQDSFLFSETVRENLAFGFDDLPPPEAVARAAEASALGPDLAALPEGLDT
ncbi:MAG: ABC transporter ATP-binding protein, partial [Planctomycetota bacterium]